MEPRNLPIRFFSKRGTQDERATEGGGGDPPSWVLGGEPLAEKAAVLRRQLNQLSTVVEDRPNEYDFVPTVARVTMNERALAKSYRPEIGRVFGKRGVENLIGLEEDLDLLVSLAPREDIETTLRHLENQETYRVGISGIDEIQPFRPIVELPTEEGFSLKVKLLNFGNADLNTRIQRVFESMLDEADIPYQRRSYAFDMIVYKLAYVDESRLTPVTRFAALHSLVPMPTVGVGLDELDTEEVEFRRKTPADDIDYVTVGVLDSGIEAVEHLRPWLLDDHFSVYPEVDMDRTHGTASASILLYGDELEGRQWTRAGAFKLLDAAVFPKKNIRVDEDDLIDNIRRAIEAHPNVRIWNLSGGGKTQCAEREFSDFAKALDDLQKRFDVLICTSAGNCENFRQNLLPERVATSADSLLAVTVGSAVHEQPDGDHAEIDHPSPFSRSGYGPNRIIKPDVSHYGGNAMIGFGRQSRFAGVKVVTPSGAIRKVAGTSFSTPRVTALAAGLAQRVDGDIDPLLLRALIVHSAKYGTNLSLVGDDRTKRLGYGIPQSVEDILFNPPWESTLILQDRVEKDGGYIEILDFPYPQGLVDDDGFYKGEIFLTLVFSPCISSLQGAEYCQSDIDVKLGTYDSIRQRDTTRRTVINPIGINGSQNLLLKSLYSTVQRRENVSFTPERQLRDNRLKYHPVKKFAVTLSELTPANRRRHLRVPKKWYLRLEGLYAAAAEAEAQRTGEVLVQDFCLIVTIRDPERQHSVYNEVAQNLTAFNFEHESVHVRNEVQVRVE